MTYWVSALRVIAVLHTAIHLYMREGGREGGRRERGGRRGREGGRRERGTGEGDTDSGMYTYLAASLAVSRCSCRHSPQPYRLREMEQSTCSRHCCRRARPYMT